MRKLLFISLIVILFSCENKSSQNSSIVSNVEELELAIENAKEGTEIILENGIWKDVQIKFKGNGTKENPIVLKAETAGKVFIEGQSDLKIAGEFLVVEGLYFRNGFTPSKTIIEFKIDKEEIANNCRITNCVIEEFTQIDREKTDHWIEFWGKNNQLDHCYIAGKSNFGPTLRVFLKGNENIYTHHQIINNHFGPRPRKGGPHGETMQIGDSETSMVPSFVLVANNYFEHCDGEVEIISSKSNFNEFRNNIFFECEGSLVLRHGNYAIIDGNIFIGNDNSTFIGGIRVINTGHWITNNYFYKIKGNEFRSALAVMNGIPKSPLNRYNQVTDVVVAYNSYIDCKTPWQFSVGANTDKSDVLPASEIRSARPERMLVANNLIYNREFDEFPVKAYNIVDGVEFQNNVLNSINKSDVQNSGIETKSFELEKISDYFLLPQENLKSDFLGFNFESIEKDLFGSFRDENIVGAIRLPLDKNILNIDKTKYGADWFSNETPSYTPQQFKVSTETELIESLKKAIAGDVIKLAEGNYSLTESLEINKEITITSADTSNKAKILYSGNTDTPAFLIYPKGNLILDNIILTGGNEQNAIATIDKNMSKAFNLKMNNTEIYNFKSVLKVSKGSFADTISFTNSRIENCLNGFQLAEEIDAKGDYNVEFLIIKNSSFKQVDQNVINYYRGGYEESTIGGNLVLENNQFINCGAKEKSEILIQTYGIVNVDFAKNTFKNNPVKYVAILWGEKGQQPIGNSLSNSGEIKVEQNLKQKLMY